MSLYHEAASILTGPTDSGGPLKSRIYNNKTLKSSPAYLYALVSETLKWGDVLREVVERSQLLSMERKLTPILAVLLVHDLLLRNEIAATASHPLKLAVTRHKARLNAEFVRARLRRGFSSIDALRASVNLNGGTETKVLGDKGGKESARYLPHPRWVRINTLRTTLETQLETTFAEYSSVCSLASILEAPSSKRVLHVDLHIPDLLALPPGADLTSSAAYMRGDIIFQDKASCFPAYLLDPSPDGEIIDACAAPGNKTTHLAALLSARCRAGGEPLKSTSIWGFERDKTRAETLKKLVETAGANHIVTVIAGQDSLRTDPDSRVWENVTALLLDPSCSGSGIVGRDEMPHLVLPSRDTKVQVKARNNKKRKRKSPQGSPAPEGTIDRVFQDGEELPSDALSQRLSSLSAFQLKLLLHSFRFPSVRKVVYSTCSIYAEENEHVVVRALNSDVARHMGWRILRREEQVAGLNGWGIRGSLNACKGLEDGSGVTKEVVAEACLRCSKGGKEGTTGFFVVGFVRDSAAEERGSIAPGYRDAANWNGEDEEWEGFSDGSSASSVVPTAVGLDRSDRMPVGKKGKRKKSTYSPARA